MARPPIERCAVRSQLILIVSSLVVAGILIAGSASAAAPYQTKVTVSGDAPSWHGDVKSSGNSLQGVRSCERKRLVKMYKRRDGKDRLIGTDLSNRAGRWYVPDEPTKGIYYAKVTARRPGDKPACAPDRSGLEYVD
jgi:hypothetical protein